MAQINPYLNFNGNCEEAFNLYKSVFGGEIPYVGRYRDMPPSENSHAGEIDGNLVMHMSLVINKDTIIMGSDVGGEWAKNTVVGNNIQLSINAESEQDATRIFNALAEGGAVKMRMGKTFWGAFFGMLTDKFGINWMVSCEDKKKA